MTPLERRGKIVVGVLMIAILGLTLTLLQQRFDEGDYERAVALLYAKQDGAAWSVKDELLQRAADASVECQPRLLSSLRGTLEVVCRIAGKEPYRFVVDLIRKRVDPEDARAREVLDAVANRNHRPTDGG